MGISKSQKIKIIILITLMLVTAVAGVTYAYFSINVTGNEDASSISVTTANLSLAYIDGNLITISNIYPGWSATKTFTINNTGNATAHYDIQIKDVYSTFSNDEFIYTLTSTNGGASITTERVMPNNDASIVTKVSINAGVSQVYTLRVLFKEMGYAQDYNQGVIYRAKIQIISPYTYTNDGVQDITLQNRILLDNEIYADNVASKYVTGTGINYANTSDYAYTTYKTTIETVSLTSSSNKYLATNFEYYGDAGSFQLTGTKSGAQTYSSASVGKYTANANTNVTGTLAPLYKILEVDGSTITKAEVYTPVEDKAIWNGYGFYSTSTNTDTTCEASDLTYVSSGVCNTYFFRGDVRNNYVSFAGTTWRIVRINEDGSIRMIKETSDGSSKFNATSSNAMYLGYMYGTSASPYTNTEDSTIKDALEQSWSNNLKNYSNYLYDAGFCNDREIDSTHGNTIFYKARYRLYLNKTPQYLCPNKERDLFTVSGNSLGNGALLTGNVTNATGPIGLISADEVVYAGGVYMKNSRYYLTNGSYFWTSSPFYYIGYYSATWRIYPSGFVFTGYIFDSNRVRPLVSLDPSTLVLGGSGTLEDPYIITNGGSWVSR